MKTKDIRKTFLDYFESFGHKQVSSSSLIPQDDPTLLFTNAGMNQFKNIFLGLEKRDYTKATSIQKCVRAGGKHNDLDNVGFTARHHTFFEMLGNFSFGDYFKQEAIAYAWEFITKNLSLPKSQLYVSILKSDTESFDIWTKKIGLSKDRVSLMGESDNYWRMGASGPCGPCSEIYFDLGEEVGGDPKKNVVGGDGDRFLEIWNLVFMQFNETASGEKTKLPHPSVDTGMGLERIASVLQGELSSYHADENLSLIYSIADKAKVSYEKKIDIKEREQHQTNVALRVLTDHAKAAAFLIGDGVLASNEGRGYVLRRIMRRAIRYGRKISADEKIFCSSVEEAIKAMKKPYPYLNQQKEIIIDVAEEEQKKFLKTLDQGTELFSQFLKKTAKKTQFSAEAAFKLYDTYGFPLDLTQIMAAENGLSVDQVGFESLMNEAKKKARLSWKGTGMDETESHLLRLSQEIKNQNGPTKFTGYMYNMSEEGGKILSLFADKKERDVLKEGEQGFVILDKTCCYAEGGGQAGDKGASIRSSLGEAELLDCIKKNDIHIHSVMMREGSLSKGEFVNVKLNINERKEITYHHSCTHLLHSALRNVLGTHITQAGSLVEPHRLRFDFTHSQPLSLDELFLVEDLVNRQIRKGDPVEKKSMSYDKAIESGVLALFGEKYGDYVRVLQMGEFSQELCGGTHVNNTAEIKAFKILSETGVSSGVRRIEALAGNTAIDFLMQKAQQAASVCLQLNASDLQVVSKKVESLQKEVKSLKLNLKNAQSQSIDISQIISGSHKIKTKTGDEVRLVFEKLNIENREALGQINDRLRDQIGPGVVVTIGSGTNGSHPIIVSISQPKKKACSSLHAGSLLKNLAPLMKGQGGGRPTFAQGTVESLDGFNKALHFTKNFISES